ncbi:MAG: hypothetical protein HQ558_04100 [Candidatus Omnitrophica bacterium]|nr:hypothetical protein [Candidatus Omnitrophota bacterium]
MISRKRKQYIIKRAFQFKYTGTILFFIFLTAILSCGVVYFATFPYLSEKLANVYPQGRLTAVLGSAYTKLFLSTALMVPIAVWFGIILSHRVAGPWYRLENIIRGIAEGDHTLEVKLRKGDELQSLAGAINTLTKSLRDMGQENLEVLSLMDETLGALKGELEREPIDLMKAKLLLSKTQDTASELKALIKKYKLAPQ